MADNELAKGSVDAFARGRTELLSTSVTARWPHLVLEEHLLKPGEWPASRINGPVLAFWETSVPLRCDHPDAEGRFVPQLVPPSVLSLFVTGELPPVRPSVPVMSLICGLDRDYFSDALGGIESQGNLRCVADGFISQSKRCFNDDILKKILLQLREELRNGGQHGPDFIEERSRALASRLRFITRPGSSNVWQWEQLDPALLRCLSEHLQDQRTNCNISVRTLAKVARCSERQLLRLFKAKTGRSPYQYVLDLRLEAARRMMLQRCYTLADIALECGFSSHPHFTQSFRSRFGFTPKAFRGLL